MDWKTGNIEAAASISLVFAIILIVVITIVWSRSDKLVLNGGNER